MTPGLGPGRSKHERYSVPVKHADQKDSARQVLEVVVVSAEIIPTPTSHTLCQSEQRDQKTPQKPPKLGL